MRCTGYDPHIIFLAPQPPGKREFAPTPSWTTMVTTGLGCHTASLSDVYQLEAGALPRDHLARMAATTETLMRSATAPKVVKDLSRCIRTMIATDYPERVPISAIRLTHVCGDAFRVGNSGQFWIDVAYRVPGTEESGAFSVAPDSNRVLVTETNGPVILSYMGKDIRKLTNRGPSCPGVPQ